MLSTIFQTEIIATLKYALLKKGFRVLHITILPDNQAELGVLDYCDTIQIGMVMLRSTLDLW